MEIRLARPDDRGPIAELMYSSGPALYDFVYQTPKHASLDYIAMEFASGQGFCGWQNVTVAVQDGEVIATGCFFDSKAYPDLVKGSLRNLFRFFGPLRALPALRRAGHISSVMKPPRPGELYLSNFGVSPALRGSGIGSAIITQQIAAARALGYQTFALDVADSNPRAEALYGRHGLKVVKQKTFSGQREGMVIPNARKMELALT